MKQVVLVAHGSPSEPEPQEAALQALVARLGALCPGDEIRGATLASPGALARALDGLERPLIYPFFMAEGWFTRREMPRRIAELGVEVRYLRPLGLEPGLPDLIARDCLAGAKTAGIEPNSSDLILVGHGSKVARKSKDTTYAMAETLRRRLPFWRVRVALIEEPPFLVDIARESPGGVCLPFFALRAGHVAEDIPQALAEAGFDGVLLDPIGAHPGTAELIAAAIARAEAP
ncbi:hypothetical protein LPB142_01005 [Rhodobacter xanthinilyticus]|uniref:Cobalamin biosynthesis protein CbiX n=1 Tax=Rhodobacter xanthinilyticus TaxID=1850250 RepID=A0A1D9M894_9RHOB|nr:CbiX/SirB N-terminal domain-containing protein [Rhodobacter xanthinilyticus]AOZ68067.1 hypothetical protein LPB142_01005 [Rhodobacter xanthinilyticus]